MRLLAVSLPLTAGPGVVIMMTGRGILPRQCGVFKLPSDSEAQP